MTVLSKPLFIAFALTNTADGAPQVRGRSSQSYWQTGMAKPIVKTMAFMTPNAVAQGNNILGDLSFAPQNAIMDMINPFSSSEGFKDMELAIKYKVKQGELTTLMQDDTKMKSRFEEFMTGKYGQHCNALSCMDYTLGDDDIEGHQKFANFQNNVKKAYNRNLYSDGHVVHGITTLMDLSREDFFKMLGYRNDMQQMSADVVLPIEDEKFDVDPNGKKDWRDDGAVTPVKDQATCGSCWAFSATETLESAALVQGLTSKDDPFIGAPAQLVDCEKKDMGCSGGLPSHAFAYLKKHGMEEEKDYPYHPRDERCKAKKAKGEYEVSKSIHVAHGNKGEKTNMHDYVLNKGTLSIGVHANDNWMTYTGGVMTYDDCDDSQPPNHAVQIVAVDTDASTPYWTIRNSWNTGWGEDGFIKLTFGQNACALSTDVWAVEAKKASEEDEENMMVV